MAIEMAQYCNLRWPIAALDVSDFLNRPHINIQFVIMENYKVLKNFVSENQTPMDATL